LTVSLETLVALTPQKISKKSAISISEGFGDSITGCSSPVQEFLHQLFAGWRSYDAFLLQFLHFMYLTVLFSYFYPWCLCMHLTFHKGSFAWYTFSIYLKGDATVQNP